MTSTDSTIDYAISIDGTRIGFERFGHGPGIVLVQGAMGTAYTFRELALALADSFTVIVPDRRGRGLSPKPYYAEYTIEDDAHDLDAVLEATGARFVFGLSAGADIALTAALTSRSSATITRLAVYEPAIFLDGLPADGVARYHAYSDADDLAGVLVTGMKLAELGPGFLRRMPDWLVKAGVRSIMKREAKAGSGGYARMADLARAFRYDFAVVQAMAGAIPQFARLTSPVLLLGGSQSPTYLTRALDQLEQSIPHASRVTLDGADHAAAWNIDPQRNPHGDPTTVAAHLAEFFGAQNHD